MNKGQCGIFLKNLCLGCSGMEEDIDKVKQYCETYKEFYRKGVRDTNGKSSN